MNRIVSSFHLCVYALIIAGAECTSVPCSSQSNKQSFPDAKIHKYGMTFQNQHEYLKWKYGPFILDGSKESIRRHEILMGSHPPIFYKASYATKSVPKPHKGPLKTQNNNTQTKRRLKHKSKPPRQHAG